MNRKELYEHLDAEIRAEGMKAEGWGVGQGKPPELTAADVRAVAELATERLRALLAGASRLTGGAAKLDTWGKKVEVTYGGTK